MNSEEYRRKGESGKQEVTEKPCLRKAVWTVSEVQHGRLTSGFYTHTHSYIQAHLHTQRMLMHIHTIKERGQKALENTISGTLGIQQKRWTIRRVTARVKTEDSGQAECEELSTQTP